jgi:branched-chain amino acid transport system substrate-binding protein
VALKVGVALPLSGPREPIGRSSREGIDLALEDLGARSGRRLAPVYVDVGSPTEGVPRFRALMAEGVVAIVGEPPVGRSLRMSIGLDELSVPMLVVSPEIGTGFGGSPNAFHGCPVDLEPQAAALFAVRQLQRRRLAVLFTAGPAEYAARWFASQADRLGSPIVAAAGVERTLVDARDALERLQREADLIYAPLPPQELRRIVRMGAELGIPGPVFLGAWDEGFDGGGKDLDGAYFTTRFAVDSPSPRTRAFVAAYESHYHHDPSAPAATAYDAMLLLADALGRAHDGSAGALRAALLETTNLAGVTGDLSMNALHDAERAVPILSMIRGELRHAGAATVAEPAPSAPPLRQSPRGR